MFKMELNKEKKLFVITMGGFFREDEGKKFLDDYNTNVKSITPASYTLVLDGSGLLTSKQDMLPVLKNCVSLYKSSGFKSIVSLPPSSKTAEMQLLKAIEEVGTKIKFVDTIDNL